MENRLQVNVMKMFNRISFTSYHLENRLQVNIMKMFNRIFLLLTICDKNNRGEMGKININ